MDGVINFLLSEKQKEKLEKNREIVFAYSFDRNLRFKINIFYQRGFLSVSLRYIPYQVPTISSLGLNPILKELIKENKGLIIVSGPFGSGRSTTMASMVEEINKNRKEYIITIEDPIEYIFTNNNSIIEQREVGSDTNSFTDALKYFEEEDGDILMLEEIKSPAVVPIVLEIARGSALVLSTVSADSASNTISRIFDMFPSYDQDRVRNLLSTALNAIVCQKIVSRIGGGVVMVQEVLVVNEAVRSIIMGGNISGLDNIIQTSRGEGMVSFNNSLAELVMSRQISREDAILNSPDKRVLEQLLR